ncbi:MAG: DUF1285 domain-containing protein [Pseudomonadales bacterium]|jgi:hypothetical protein|nr:DUF1285 domain-containing protein [Pseudomonadales bacterium]
MATDADNLFETLLAERDARRLPPVEQWQPEREGTIDIRIARDGTWYHQGDPIRREAMVRLFASILRLEDGRYFLVTPVEKLAIEVEDAPLQAIALERDGEGEAQRLLLTTNGGDHVLVDAQHGLRVEDAGGDPDPYVHVRAGLEARLTRPVFYELARLAVPAADAPEVMGVWSDGAFFPLGEVEDGG